MNEERLLEIARPLDDFLTASEFEIDDSETMAEWPIRMASFKHNGLKVDYTLDVKSDAIEEFAGDSELILDARLYGKASSGIPLCIPYSHSATNITTPRLVEKIVSEEITSMLKAILKARKDMIFFLHGLESLDVGMVKWEGTSWGAYAYDRFGEWMSAPDLTYAGESALKQRYDPEGNLPPNIDLWATSPFNIRRGVFSKKY